MTDKITIPPAALEAGARAAMDDAGWQWDTSDEFRRDIWRRTARAAFEAMVTAWPKWLDMDADPGAALILPLTEKTDDKA